MISRRELAAGITGLTLTPGFAGVQARSSSAPPPGVGLDLLSAGFTRFNQTGRYLAAWSPIAADGSPANRDIRQQWAAILGDETMALANARRSHPAPDLAGARAEDAIAAIVRASAGRRVVMLNEAHVASRHRLFFARVARALAAEGFTHLAAETFQNSDFPGASRVEALKTGDALRPSHGYYIIDPVFAEATREALALGYQLAAYEQRADQGMQAGGDAAANVAAREQAQAENLSAALRRWPHGRFLVYVGYGHLSKVAAREGGPLMGARFMALTGIEPLTIQQDATGSFGPHAPDSAATAAVLARFKPKDAVAVVGADGAALNSRGLACDLTVFHPSRGDIDGRPGWLAGAQGRRPVAVRLPTPAPAGLALAQAVPASDPDPAIPADQYLLAEGARQVVFHLRPGRYRIRLETPEGFQPVGEARA